MKNVKIVKKENLEAFFEEFKRKQYAFGKAQVYLRLLENDVALEKLEEWFDDVHEILQAELIQIACDENMAWIKEQLEQVALIIQREARKDCFLRLLKLKMGMNEILTLLGLSSLDVNMVADLAEVIQENEKPKGFMN